MSTLPAIGIAVILPIRLLTETLDAESAGAHADYVYTDTWLDMEFFNDPAYAQEKQQRCDIMLPYRINS